MEIRILDKQKWKGYMLDFSYTSRYYYDYEREDSPNGWVFHFTKKKFETPFHNPDHQSDCLYSDDWKEAIAYGAFEGDTLVGAIETCPEWNHRLRVTEMWVDQRHRRIGIGSALMEHVKQIAKEEGRRALVLETQSRNAGAIAFYISQGYTMIGFDECCYSNNDMEREGIRIEMGLKLC